MFAVALSNMPGTKGLWIYCLPFSNVSYVLITFALGIDLG